jgi:hypothetical protein
MDLNYDYGDVIHSHGHIHTKPESHKQVVEHALKDWCHNIFGDEADEKCDELNEIAFHDIDDGTQNDMKVSDVYKALISLQNLTGKYKTVDGIEEEIIDIVIKGTILTVTGVDDELKIKKNDNGFFLGTDNFEILENGIKNISDDKFYTKTDLYSLSDSSTEFNKLKYDTNAVKDFKQMLRNLNLEKLQEEMSLVKKNIEVKEKELQFRKDIKVDEVSAKRKIDNLENVEQDRIREIIILVMLLIIAICFGIYCIYNFFVLEL